MSDDALQEQLPETIGGRYRVVGEIGRGGMGRVIKVTHLHTGETLAMKLLLLRGAGRDKAVERFRREARSLAQVRGDHVVRVIDADLAPEVGGLPYLVMELLEGEDLGRYVNRRGKLSPADAVPLLQQVAQGLARVHKAGLVHRDLKPANIFLHHVDHRVVVKLLDFGLVRPAGGSSQGHDEVTGRGEILGTPLFMSPEQIHGTPESVGPATDIWAAGIVAFYLLTGRAYWNLQELPRGMFDIGVAPLRPPSTLDPSLSLAFDAWFLRSCSRNPATRWPDPLMQVQELALALGVPYNASGVFVLPQAHSAAADEETRVGPAPTPAMTPVSALPSTGGQARQRRQVTVLFYRLVHRASASEEIDPEEFEASEARLHAKLDPALGDLSQTGQQMARGGRFVFYGYPVAYGSDARRAVEAARRLVSAAASESLQVRVGIHTGVVLAGPSADMPGSSDIVGQALGVASDLEHHAAPGQIVVSDATWRLLGSRFEGRALEGDRHLVLGPAAGATTTSAATAIVGRHAELAILEALLQDARAGESQAALVTGEVGIGKSRLLQALRESASAEEVEWLECQCSPYFQRTAFHPMVQLLRSDAGGRLRSIGHDADVTESLEFLLSAPGADRSPLAALSPMLRRDRAIQALITVLHQAASVKPVVLVVEDLHWADPSSLELLDRLSVLKTGNVLTILTARPDFVPAWTSPAAITPIQLRRLPQAQAAQLIAQVAGRQLPSDLAAQVAKTTDGIPLFIEELSRLLTDSREDATRGVLSAMAVPTSLGEALNARLDRLGTARAMAELASVIGMTFDADDVQALAGDDAGVPAKIQELVRAKIVQPIGLPPHRAYAFQHALLREAAYGSLPKPARRTLHLAVAQLLAGRRTSPPEVLAYHFEEAGRAMEAAGLLLQAGQEALTRSANAEARGHFSRGVDVLDKYRRSSTPPPAIDPALDLTLRTMLGMAWVVSRGYAAPEAEAAFSDAMRHLHALGDQDAPGSIPALWANWVFMFVTGRMSDAAAQSARLRAAADRSGDPGAAMMADLAEGTVLFDQAKYANAVQHLDRALAGYDPQAHAPYRFMYGQDPRMYGTVFKAWSLWCTGDADVAVALAEEAVSHAKSLAHPNSYGFALAIAAIIYQCRGDVDALAAKVATLNELSLQQGWVQWLGLARLFAGASDVMQGRIDEGLTSMREARAMASAFGDKAGGTHYDSVLVDGLCRAGHLDEAAERLAIIRQDISATGERAFEPDVIRLEGEVARLRGDRNGARELFTRARDLARATGALSYLNRAEESLAALDR